MAQHTDIADLLQGLPTLPAIPVQIMRRMDDPLGCDLREIARLAERDPIVSAQLLRLANSALVGGLGRAETAIDAVVRLGLSDTRKIVLTIALVETFPDSADSFDVRRFWTFSLASALCAEHVAKGIGYVSPARAYLAGLVHRIGDAALALGWPERFAEALEHARRASKTLDEGIEKIFQVQFVSSRICARMCCVSGTSRI